jgi:hypothetical protein
MENALCCSLIQGFCRGLGSRTGFFQIAALNREPGFFEGCARPTAVHAVQITSLFILTIAFDLRFNICQGLTSNNFLDDQSKFTKVNFT